MTFALVGSVYTDGSGTISAAFLNYVRAALPQAGDFAGGTAGTPYTPLTTVQCWGAGMDIRPLSGQVGNTKTLEWVSGSTLLTDVGATVTFNSGVTFDGNTAFYGTNSVLAGSWGFYVDAYVISGATLRIGDTVNGPGHLLVEAASAGAGSGITVQGSGGQIELKANTTLIMDSGSTATMSGASTISNLASATQTGPFTKSGTGARTNLRIGRPATPDADQTFDPTQWDIITLNNLTSFATTRTWTLSDPTFSAGQTAVVYVAGDVVHVIGGGAVINFKNSAGTTIATFGDTSTGGGALFYWEDAGSYSTWLPLLKWGAVT